MADFDFTTLITDRTYADTQRLQYLRAKWLDGTISEAEKTEWMNGLKGAYNYTDMNRVGEALLYFKELLSSYGYEIPTVAFDYLLTNWSTESDIRQLQWDAYFEAIKKTSEVLQLDPAFSLPQNLQGLDIEKANNIEKMFLSLKESIERLAQSFIYSGEAYSGEI